MIEQATHTPGPWRVDGDVIRHKEVGLAVVHEFHHGFPGTAEANARLIAAAPDLLKELKNALPYLKKAVKFFKYQKPEKEFWPNREELESIIDSANATISKAIGEQSSGNPG